MNLQNQRSSQKAPLDHHSSAQESPFDEKYLKNASLISPNPSEKEKLPSQDAKRTFSDLTEPEVIEGSAFVVNDNRISRAMASAGQSLLQTSTLLKRKDSVKQGAKEPQEDNQKSGNALAANEKVEMDQKTESSVA